MAAGVRKQGCEISVLSGDNERDKEALEPILGSGVDMRFNQKPEDRLSYLTGEQGAGEHCVMVGDGLNDAGALSQSRVGIGVIEEMNAFTPASDAILHGPQLPQLHKLMKLSKDAVRVVWMSFGLSFAYNTVGMYFAVSGLLSPVLSAILMPLSSITVVLFVTAATNIYGRRRGLQ
jgi:Cu+-exporting ATPase